MKTAERISPAHVVYAAFHRIATTPITADWALALSTNYRLSAVIVEPKSVCCID